MHKIGEVVACELRRLKPVSVDPSGIVLFKNKRLTSLFYTTLNRRYSSYLVNEWFSKYLKSYYV